MRCTPDRRCKLCLAKRAHLHDVIRTNTVMAVVIEGAALLAVEHGAATAAMSIRKLLDVPYARPEIQ